MKKFFLSVSVVAAFALYTFLRQYAVADNSVAGPVSGVLPDPTPAQPTSSSPSSAPTIIITTAPQPSPTTPPKKGQYADGTYTGDAYDAFYGNIQVQAVISGGKLTDVRILQYPNDRSTSIEINSQALPMLRQEAIAAQSANVDIISGATDSSSAFRQSLGSALKKAV